MTHHLHQHHHYISELYCKKCHISYFYLNRCDSNNGNHFSSSNNKDHQITGGDSPGISQTSSSAKHTHSDNDSPSNEEAFWNIWLRMRQRRDEKNTVSSRNRDSTVGRKNGRKKRQQQQRPTTDESAQCIHLEEAFSSFQDAKETIPHKELESPPNNSSPKQDTSNGTPKNHISFLSHASPVGNITDDHIHTPHILIRPTFGFDRYKPFQSLLHCGFCDGDKVVHYLNGKVRRDSVWKQALIIKMPERNQPRVKTGTDLQQDSHSTMTWSKFLHNFEQKERKRPQKYHDIQNNCFDFLMRGWNQWYGVGEAVKEGKQNDPTESDTEKPKTTPKLCTSKMDFMRQILENRIVIMESWMNLFQQTAKASQRGEFLKRVHPHEAEPRSTGESTHEK